MNRTTRAETGLLEQVVLVVRAATGGRVLATEAGEAVGRAAWRREGWCGWSLAVYEQEQSPLVCTVRRRFAWPFRREVRDAEGELVGFLSGAALLDRWERPAMRLVDGRFVGDGGEALATWSGGRLELLGGVRHDPFAKMLIVAAVAAWG